MVYWITPCLVETVSCNRVNITVKERGRGGCTVCSIQIVSMSLCPVHGIVFSGRESKIVLFPVYFQTLIRHIMKFCHSISRKETMLASDELEKGHFPFFSIQAKSSFKQMPYYLTIWESLFKVSILVKTLFKRPLKDMQICIFMGEILDLNLAYKEGYYCFISDAFLHVTLALF